MEGMAHSHMGERGKAGERAAQHWLSRIHQDTVPVSAMTMTNQPIEHPDLGSIIIFLNQRMNE